MPDRVHLEEAEFEITEAPESLSQALDETTFGGPIPSGVVVAFKDWPVPGKVVLCAHYDYIWYQLIREVRS